ncbi:transketolase family protein [Methanoregula sp. UBA64]|jgi:transketolase|uniref:transketolase family protein n=1 Tax=Methanoregula sp. UBA64 TaxID=1915554 RepID=UPI0025F32D18|nr:transketolase C-terminal domain-containing protein [Methanoregula sp. UBA64]
MRTAVSDEITELAGSDPRIVVLVGDTSHNVFDRFKEIYPSRFFNCGIAESNMISVAAGLAMNGFRPFIYSFSTFDIGRPFEQLRIDLAFQNLPVVIIGLGGGLAYSHFGPTHSICEDIAITRVLPNMTVICPCDQVETRAAIRASLQNEGPTYIRIGREKEPIIHTKVPEFIIGSGIPLEEGTDICILGTGTILHNIIEAAHILRKSDLKCQVISLHTIKPLDTRLLENIFSMFPLVITVEEHSLIGGLGSAVAEWLVDQHRPLKAQLVRIGIPDEFLYHSANQKTAREIYELSSKGIADTIQMLSQR